MCRKLLGIGSLSHHVEPWNESQVVWFGGKCLYPLNLPAGLLEFCTGSHAAYDGLKLYCPSASGPVLAGGQRSTLESHLSQLLWALWAGSWLSGV